MTQAPQHQDPRVGTLFDGAYRIKNALGRGMMGTVYRAIDIDDSSEVAIKVLAKRWVTHEQTAKRFQREGDILARLDHPNVLRMHELSVSDDGTPYLVTELVVGRTLREVLSSEWPLTPERLHAFALQLWLGLGYAHAVGGVVHRDIKPDNVLIADDDVLKIVDFGISKCLFVEQTALTEKETVLGSPAYMAPEQIMGKPGFRSDIYAGGCLLYECLTGHTLFPGRKLHDIVSSHLYEPPTWPSVDGRRLDGALVELTMRCLVKQPEERPRSANTLVDALGDMDPRTCVSGYATEEPAPTVMLMPAAGGSDDEPRKTVELREATITLHRAALTIGPNPNVDEPDAREFQSLPLFSKEMLDAMPKPTATQAFKVGYMERVPSGMWQHRDLDATKQLHSDAQAASPEVVPETVMLASQTDSGTSPNLERKLWVGIGAAAFVLVIIVIVLMTGGCVATPDVTRGHTSYSALTVDAPLVSPVTHREVKL